MKSLWMGWLVSLILIGNQVSAAEEVKLLHGFSSVGARYGSQWQNTLVDIAVRKIGDPADQRVSVVINDCAGGWTEVLAHYERDLNEDFELWKATDLSSVFPFEGEGSQYSNKICDLIFSVRYEADENIYWDNNGGRDYYIAANGGALIADRVYLNHAYLNQTGQDVPTTIFSGSMYIKNIAPQKKVFVIYSVDDWENSSLVEAQYQTYQYYGYSSVKSHNDQGVEFWTFNTTLGPVKRVEFAVVYEVEFQQIWDNNWGANYVVETIER